MSNNPDYLMFQHKLTSVDDEKIKAFTTHGEFNELGVELLKEIAMLLVPVAAIYRTDGNGNKVPFKHEEAALIGNLVRYCKLSTAFLEQITKKRVETSLIFFRCLAETYINLKFFLKFQDEHTLRHYIKNSLRVEKELLDIIKRNVAEKEETEHIEERMMASINRTFRTSDFEEDDINNSSKWDAKVKARVKEIIHPHFYVLIYGLASHAVHGNWQDIINCHLEQEGEGFLPDTDWTMPTLQIISATTVLSCDLLHNYASEVLPDSENKTKLIENIEYIMKRTFKLDQQHEIFTQKQSRDTTTVGQ